MKKGHSNAGARSRYATCCPSHHKSWNGCPACSAKSAVRPKARRAASMRMHAVKPLQPHSPSIQARVQNFSDYGVKADMQAVRLPVMQAYCQALHWVEAGQGLNSLLARFHSTRGRARWAPARRAQSSAGGSARPARGRAPRARRGACAPPRPGTWPAAR